MNLQTTINNQLWIAIKDSYDSKNYCHGINDAIHFLTDVIREKSGFDDDGEKLISKSFGGENPVIKINKLQTQTEKDIQRGTEALLRGMYQAIRNPRSHEQVKDDVKTADAIILFVDYLITIIDKAKPPFEFDVFLNRVLDKHFVRENEYIEDLVNTIPTKQRFEVLLKLINKREFGEIENFVLVIREIIKNLNQEQLSDLYNFVSEGFTVVDDYTSIRISLEILDPPNWKMIERSARLRIENILLDSIREGRSYSCNSIIDDMGAIGTFGREYLIMFNNQPELRITFLHKLKADYSEQVYVFCFFLNWLPSIFTTKVQMETCIKLICNAVISEENYVDGGLRSILESEYNNLPDEWRTGITALIPDINDDIIPF